MKCYTLFFTFLQICCLYLAAETDRYRATWRDDPRTTMILAWDQMVGEHPILYYDSVDYGRQVQNYTHSVKPHATWTFKGMRTCAVRLTGLKPNTAYYFLIADSNSISRRMWFQTAGANHEPFTFVAGGNAYHNRAANIRANRMVARLQPLFVAFTGDMTPDSSPVAWRDWLDQWQETLAPDGRVIPLIPARGERERGVETLGRIFGYEGPSHFGLSFGNALLRLYTLDTEAPLRDQTAWLKNDLAAHGAWAWRMVQYHHPMRPHNRRVRRGAQYGPWARLFHNHGVQLALEGHGQTVKTTWPVRPEALEYEGFVRDQDGTVYVGEGSWGAPLRKADAPKPWTRESGSFPQLKWVHVSRDALILHTVLLDNVLEVDWVDPHTPHQPPANLRIWQARGGPLTLVNPKAPKVSITQPTPNALFPRDGVVTLAAALEDTPREVRFYADGVLMGVRSQAPWSLSFQLPRQGNHRLTVTATSEDGLTGGASVPVGVEHLVLTVPISHGSDDVEEFSDGRMYMNSTDFEFTEDTPIDPSQTLALRFRNVKIPKGSKVLWAAIQFTVDELSLFHTDLNISASQTSEPFEERPFNISRRPRTRAFVNWKPPSWPQIGASGPDQRTPDLGSLVQEIADHPSWRSGNALVFIFQGTGRHVAKTYESQSPAVLHLAYTHDQEQVP